MAIDAPPWWNRREYPHIQKLESSATFCRW